MAAPGMDWFGLLSKIAGWLALVIAARREWRERATLHFALNFGEVMEGDEESPGEIYTALSFDVTNKGSHPITIAKYVCSYSYSAANGRPANVDRREQWANVKLSEGERTRACLPVSPAANLLKYVAAIDSTEKEWAVSPLCLYRLHKRARHRYPSLLIPTRRQIARAFIRHGRLAD